jgi:hypothetical protein
VKRWERWAFNVSALLVAATGFIYFWMKYLLENPDPFAVVNHPWEPAMLHLHVLASPAFILVFGIILNSHIVKKLGAARVPNRKTGLSSLALFSAMIGSGYLLQVMTDDTWLRALLVLHVGSGALFTLTYTAHLVISARLGRRRPAAAPMRDVA